MESWRQGSSSGSLAAAAAAHRAPSEAAEVVKMRIVDWLREPDEQDEDIDGFSTQRLNLCVPSSGTALPELLPKWPFRLPKRSPGSGCGSRRLLPFLMCLQKKGKEKEPGEVLAPFVSKMAEGVNGGATDGSLLVAAGRNPEERSFNLVMGIGMALILSRWETEFSKMKELQFQMEKLLKEIRNEVTKKDVVSDTTESNNNFASSSSSNENVGKCNIKSFKNHTADFQMEEADSTVESDRHSNYQISNENQSMDQLEAEVAFELEQLQFNLEGKDSVTLSERERLELAHGTTSSSESFGPQEEYHNGQGGVSASELERRLYELIHLRQQERIVELESALELSNKMLIDKEIKDSWWKDTISLLSPKHEGMIVVNSHERDHTIYLIKS